MNPALAISDALEANGYPTRASQAALLGIAPETWTRYLKGHTSPSCGKVQGWLETLASLGLPSLLAWNQAGCSMVPS